jgi:hypothetical protein
MTGEVKKHSDSKICATQSDAILSADCFAESILRIISVFSVELGK